MADQTDIVDAKETSLAAVTDDSHTAHFSEIVPLERASHDYFKPEFIEPVVEVKPEDLQDVKHSAFDDYCNAEFIDPAVQVKLEDLQVLKHLASDDYFKPEFIEPVVEVKPEDIQCVKQEPTEENDSVATYYSVKVRFFNNSTLILKLYCYEIYCIWQFLTLH